MIDITKLTDEDIWRWIIYTRNRDLAEKLEKSSAKSQNDFGMFVVYNSANVLATGPAICVRNTQLSTPIQKT